METRKRFEQGESTGKYPTLSELLSQLTEAEQEEFLRTRGRQPTQLSKPQEQSREEEPYDGVADSTPSSSTLNERVVEDERIFEELDEVFGLPGEASYKHLARLWSSRELCNEAWARFERGKHSGRFPVLSEFLSNFSNEEKETFFRTGGCRPSFP